MPYSLRPSHLLQSINPFVSIWDHKINEDGCCWSTNGQANSCRFCSSFCRWRSASCASKVWQGEKEVSVERKIEAPQKGRNSCQQWDRNTIEFQKFMLFNDDRPKKWIVGSFISLFLTFLALYRVFSLVPKFLILKWSWCCRCSWHSIQM